MKGFASFTVSGQLPAFTVVFGFSLLTFILPLSAVVSAAAIALITLHAGPKNSLVIATGCAVALSLCSYALLGQMLPGVLIVLVQLVPAIILATVFRLTQSLSFSLQAATLLGVMVFLGMTVLFPDIDRMWEAMLHQFLQPLSQTTNHLAEEMPQLIQQSARFMTGILVASTVLTNSGVMLLGYWWHCLVTGSGNFRRDFHRIQLGKVLAVIALLSGIWAFISKSAFAIQLCGVTGILFLLQGMAVMHAVTAAMTKGKIWLTAAYVLMIFVPQALFVIILTGLTDTFAGLRKRV